MCHHKPPCAPVLRRHARPKHIFFPADPGFRQKHFAVNKKIKKNRLNWQGFTTVATVPGRRFFEVFAKRSPDNLPRHLFGCWATLFRGSGDCFRDCSSGIAGTVGAALGGTVIAPRATLSKQWRPAVERATVPGAGRAALSETAANTRQCPEQGQCLLISFFRVSSPAPSTSHPTMCTPSTMGPGDNCYRPPSWHPRAAPRSRLCGDVAGSPVLPRGTPATGGAGGWFIRVLNKLSLRGVPVIKASRDEKKGSARRRLRGREKQRTGGRVQKLRRGMWLRGARGVSPGRGAIGGSGRGV
eukprot:CAMPEP_0197614938 /NCGR_PEP_ID=MMETSP1326-20131121/59779_1 /TAXON_ID=1155430 /ORGANISM="Genus nov. species nov., Strain RCC2288" /LENGTH=298 /DNA_ID=CAMNT_0043183817 /DNA_START=250 /DNA_END=1146 /DNA_ORIENTATION=-